MLTAVAMILSYVESLLPQIGIPGVKMGLANIAVIFALFRFGWKEAAALSLVRVVLVSLLFGSVGAMLYSLAGAVLSLAVMALLRRIDRFSTVGVSVAGGVAHNAGQILMAMLILQTKQLLVYLPVLAVSGSFLMRQKRTDRRLSQLPTTVICSVRLSSIKRLKNTELSR